NNRGPYHAKFRHMRGEIQKHKDSPDVTVHFPGGTSSHLNEHTRDNDVDVVSNVGIVVKEEAVSVFTKRMVLDDSPDGISVVTREIPVTDGEVGLIPGGVEFRTKDNLTVTIKTHQGEGDFRSTSVSEVQS